MHLIIESPSVWQEAEVLKIKKDCTIITKHIINSVN